MALFGGREEAWKFNIELCEWGEGKGVLKLWTCYIFIQVIMGDILNYYGNFVKQFQVWIFVCNVFFFVSWLIPK